MKSSFYGDIYSLSIDSLESVKEIMQSGVIVSSYVNVTLSHSINPYEICFKKYFSIGNGRILSYRSKSEVIKAYSSESIPRILLGAVLMYANTDCFGKPLIHIAEANKYGYLTSELAGFTQVFIDHVVNESRSGSVGPKERAYLYRQRKKLEKVFSGKSLYSILFKYDSTRSLFLTD